MGVCIMYKDKARASGKAVWVRVFSLWNLSLTKLRYFVVKTTP